MAPTVRQDEIGDIIEDAPFGWEGLRQDHLKTCGAEIKILVQHLMLHRRLLGLLRRRELMS